MTNLKILQINNWGGRIKDGLSRFIAEGDYDVVCMQEAVWVDKGEDFMTIFVDTVDRIKEKGGFKFDFRSSNFGLTMLNNDVRHECGNVILSKIPFKETEERVILGEYNVADSLANYGKAIDDHGYMAQKVVLENGVTVVNYHGYWLKDPLGGEMSTQCMRRVADMFRDDSARVVMCGDLNVVAEAQCMREVDFLTDLTAVNKVKTTLRNIRFVKDVACDHILIGKDLKCEKFEVINAPVSDHQALVAEISV